MATPQHRRPPPSFPLPDHLLELILARLPPEDPSCLLRASLVCKHWRDLIYDPRFLFLLLDPRRAPQMLGFLHDSDTVRRLEYVPTYPFSFSFPVPDRDFWYLLGYRHGRAVFHSTSATENSSLLVWVPFTGQRMEVPVPTEFKIERSYATVICAADGCGHRNCHEGPFLIVFVFCDPEDEELAFVTSGCVYSSETGEWGEVVSTNNISLICDAPALLVGKSLLYFLSNCGSILEYDVARHSMVTIDPPEHDPDDAMFKRMILVQAEDGGLGVVIVQPNHYEQGFAHGAGCDCLCLLSREVTEGGDTEWVRHEVIYLEDSLSDVWGSTPLDLTAFVIGFAEGASTVFVSTQECDGIFTVDLQSKRARKVYHCSWHIDRLAPILSSYTSGSTLQAPQGEHHCLMAWSSSDEADDEEGGGKKDQAQLLFDKGLMAIKNGGFVAAVDYLCNVLKLRVARYGELSPECASTYYQYGRALLKKAQKAQKAANHFSIAPKGAPYEKAGQNSNGEYQEDGNGDSDKDDNETARNDSDSDLDLASKMLEVARRIVKESKINTVETFRILSALTEVCIEKRKRGRL
uniref:Uncharacterized protein n=1 Tax=Avena sativa TaxID=4498 RepID=A0ACD5XIF1_AVESA